MDALPAALDPRELQRRHGWSDEDEGWRRRAAEFAARRLAPQAQAADRAGALPAATYAALGAAGLVGPAVPKARGGHGASCLAECLVAEEIGAVDGSARGFLAVQGGLVLATLGAYGSDLQRARHAEGVRAGTAIGAFALTEPEAGSDVGGLGTRLVEDGDHLVLEGEKTWITNGGIADLLLVFASEFPERTSRGLSCVLVPGDARGLERLPLEGRPLGHRGADHARLRFWNVRVPKSARIGPAGEGFRVAMAGLGAGRLHVAAGAVGIQRAALLATVGFARTRRQFGRRIGDFQQVGAALADMAVRLESSRLLVLQAARLRDRLREDRGGTEDEALERAAGEAVAAAKLAATEAAVATTLKAIQLHGSRGYGDDHPVERLHRDAIALTIYEGTSEIQRTILVRALLGREEEPS